MEGDYENSYEAFVPSAAHPSIVCALTNELLITSELETSFEWTDAVEVLANKLSVHKVRINDN